MDTLANVSDLFIGDLDTDIDLNSNYYLDWSIPDLTMDIIKQGKVDRHSYYAHTVTDMLDDNGYKSLGWTNSGMTPPEDVKFNELYSNDSGSTCIYVSHDAKLYYMVDMGD